jgi:hypothetical protein
MAHAHAHAHAHALYGTIVSATPCRTLTPLPSARPAGFLKAMATSLATEKAQGVVNSSKDRKKTLRYDLGTAMSTIQLASRPWIVAVIIVIAYLSLPVLALLHPQRTTSTTNGPFRSLCALSFFREARRAAEPERHPALSRLLHYTH